MPHVRFTADFDFSPAALGGRVTLAYRAGTTVTVTTECATAAIAAGKAVKASPPRRSERDEAS